jgi:hypothetical protein
VDPEHARALVERGWQDAARRKRRYWAERVAEPGGVEAALAAVDALRRHMAAVQPGWPSAEARRADLDHHVELKRRIDRAAAALTRR